MNLKSNGLCLVLGVLVGLWLAHSMGDRPDVGFVIDKSKQSFSGIIAKFRPGPPKKPNEPPSKPEIESIELYKSVLQNDIQTKSFKKNELTYIPKYNFGDNKLYHSALYQYSESEHSGYGGYLAENKELGLALSFRW